jgi:Heterokaryon incompatibility protein (HET)
VGCYSPSIQTDSLSSWTVAKTWINDCLDNHSECKNDPMASIFFPTRLLDLGFSNKVAGIQIIVSEERKPHGPYMTLSHCWGQAEVLKLTRENLDNLKSGIDLAELPRLYQDAVSVTRKLGVRYLWIDSLCIIQDEQASSDSDWIEEAGRMGSVYSNSYCNIAASDASDSLGTLFFERDTTTIRALEVTVEWHPSCQHSFFLFDDYPRDVLLNNPLNKRGWVLQEQLLAPRTLLFGKDQIRWECRFHEASETFPGGIPNPLYGKYLHPTSIPTRSMQFLKKWIASRDPMSVIDRKTDRHESPWESFWLSWKEVVENYTSRSLTVPSDKIPAIAGIAYILDQNTRQNHGGGSTYLAGMWNIKFSIEYELCWRVGPQPGGQPPRRPREYRAPTWSWASIDGKISYHYRRGYGGGDETHLAVVERAEVITVDGTASGPIKSGFIEIYGPLTEWDNWVGCSLDDNSIPPKGRIYWLPMFALQHNKVVWGLALSRIESGSNQGCFERVGTFRFSDDFMCKLLSEGLKQHITIL